MNYKCFVCLYLKLCPSCPYGEVRCFLLLCRLWQNNNLGVWAVRYLRGVKYMMRKIYYYEKHEKIKFI